MPTSPPGTMRPKRRVISTGGDWPQQAGRPLHGRHRGRGNDAGRGTQTTRRRVGTDGRGIRRSLPSTAAETFASALQRAAHNGAGVADDHLGYRVVRSHVFGLAPDPEREVRSMADRTDQLTGKKIAFLTANEGVEEAELSTPWEAVNERDRRADRTRPARGAVLPPPRPGRHPSRGPRPSTMSWRRLRRVRAAGWCRERRRHPHGRRRGAVRAALRRSGHPTAVICHGPWILTDVDVVRATR